MQTHKLIIELKEKGKRDNEEKLLREGINLSLDKIHLAYVKHTEGPLYESYTR